MVRRRLVAPGPRAVTLAPVHPNAGLQAAYRKKLEAEIDLMHRSILWWIRAQYRAAPPEMAQDKSPAAMLRDAMAALSRRWQKRFDTLAEKLGKWFATSVEQRSSGALKHILKQQGWTVEFRASRQVNDVLQASIAENVSLIKSIASQHFTQIEGAVMRSVQSGGDLKTLTDELEARYDVTRKRAALIARDQSSKGNAAVVRARQDELGIDSAIWMHSLGGRYPRPSHVKANGTVYKIAEGLVLDGERVWPGTAINCRCVSRAIVPGYHSD